MGLDMFAFAAKTVKPNPSDEHSIVVGFEEKIKSMNTLMVDDLKRFFTGVSLMHSTVGCRIFMNLVEVLNPLIVLVYSYLQMT
jgi:hypothetical protein